MTLRTLLLIALLSLGTGVHANEEAESAMDQWRHDLALEALNREPREDDAAWHRLRGVALMATGETEAAIEHLETAVELDPESAESHWYALPALTAQLNDSGAFGQLRLARKIRNTMETAVELDPDNPEYRHGLMQYYLQAPGIAGGSERKAREQAEILAEMDPLWGHAAQALILLSEEETEAGLEQLRLAWNNGEGLEEMAMPIVYNAQSREDWNTARNTLQQLLERKPGYPIALYQMGRTAALSGESLEAGIEALENYTQRPFLSSQYPSRAAAYWRLGELHQWQGDKDRARMAWEQSLELDPEMDEAREALQALSDDRRNSEEGTS